MVRMDEDIRPFLSGKKKVEGRHKGNLKSKRINVDLASVFPKCFDVDVIRNDKGGFIRTEGCIIRFKSCYSLYLNS